MMIRVGVFGSSSSVGLLCRRVLRGTTAQHHLSQRAFVHGSSEASERLSPVFNKIELLYEHSNAFCGNPIDKAHGFREDAKNLEQIIEDTQNKALCLSFYQGKCLLGRDADKETVSLFWLRLNDIKLAWAASGPHEGDFNKHLQFLGFDSVGTPLFAIDFTKTALKEQRSLESIILQYHRGEAGEFSELRTSRIRQPVLSREDLAIVGNARSLIQWKSTQQFCGKCGSKTVAAWGGSKRICTNKEKCGEEFYPRTDPVAIMIISSKDGQRCLLGRQAKFPPSYYSTLAGFIDVGENVEEAVRREVLEEAGVSVGKVFYHSSQPWPFPHSQLMLGFFGEALSDELCVNKKELEDARWFSRDEVQAALDVHYLTEKPRTKHSGIMIPPPFALSHQLIKAWLQKNIAK